MIPPKDVMKKLVDESVEGGPNVLDQVQYRVAWLQHQEAARRRQEEAAEKERVNYAQIDWHNFVVVETVDYQPWEVRREQKHKLVVVNILFFRSATSPLRLILARSVPGC